MSVSGLTEFQLWSKGGWPRVEVAGEFHHQDEIRSLLPPTFPESGVEAEFTAYLMPEPHNRYDRNAVRVEVQGRTVGYLPKEIAGDYATVLTSLVSRGLAPATPCRIWAYERQEWKGYDNRDRDVYERVLNAQVSIVLDAPHRILPMNVEPVGPHRTLPHGSALQVRGEEKHLDVLAPWVAQHGEGWVYGELRSIAVQNGREPKEVVEILIDGQVIGELTPAMSAHYVPAIEHGAARGESVVAKVFLKGNALKVEAVLHAAKAHELGSDWVAGVTTSSAGAPPGGSVPVDVAGEVVGPLPPPVGAGFILPPKPTRIVFNPAPGWPPAPHGWEPSMGWRPHPEWPSPPEGWQFWTAE